MKLHPMEKAPEATYPNREASTFRVLGRWVRRIGVAVAASSCFWVVGCLPIGVSGEPVDPSYFICEDETDDMVWNLGYPGSYWGSLCDGRGATGTLEIDEQVTLAISLDTGGLDMHLEATASIYDPDGVLLSEVHAGGPEVVLILEPGLHSVVVTEGATSELHSFELHIHEPEIDS